MHDISAQSSMYIPISAPPTQLPAYVSMDRSSQWHTAGLLSTALESMTLQSRLRASDGRRATLNDAEAALNVNGNQRIAKLQCSVIDPELLEEQRREGGIKEASTGDQRMPGSRVTGTSSTSGLPDDEGGLQATSDAGLRNLDMDFFAGGESETTTLLSFGQRTNIAKKTHVFGQVECFRGDFEQVLGEGNGEEEGYARKRRRIAGLPVVEKSVTFPFPFSLFLFPISYLPFSLSSLMFSV